MNKTCCFEVEVCKIEMSNEGELGGNENAMLHCNHKYELFCIGQTVHDCAKCDPAGTVADCQKLDAAARRHGRKCSPSKGGCVCACAGNLCNGPVVASQGGSGVASGNDGGNSEPSRRANIAVATVALNFYAVMLALFRLT